jgi:hypothetical protein
MRIQVTEFKLKYIIVLENILSIPNLGLLKFSWRLVSRYMLQSFSFTLLFKPGNPLLFHGADLNGAPHRLIPISFFRNLN